MYFYLFGTYCSPVDWYRRLGVRPGFTRAASPRDHKERQPGHVVGSPTFRAGDDTVPRNFIRVAQSEAAVWARVHRFFLSEGAESRKQTRSVSTSTSRTIIGATSRQS